MKTIFIFFIPMILLTIIQVKAQDSLFSKNINENGVDATFTEIKREDNLSIAKYKSSGGTAISNSMFLMECFYLIAQERKFNYFFKGSEWESENGEMTYKVFFLNDKNIPLKVLLGEDYTEESQNMFDQIGYTNTKQLQQLFESNGK